MSQQKASPPASIKVFKELWRIGNPEHKFYYVALLLMFVALFFDLSKPFLLKLSLEQITGKDLPGLYFYTLLFLGILVAEYFFRSAFNWLIGIAFLKTVNRLRKKVFDHVLSLKMAYFDKEPIGILLTRTINDTESLGETLRAGLATIVVDFLTIVGLFVVMTQINLTLTPIMVITAFVVWFTVRWFGYALKESYLRVRKNLASSNAYMSEGISGVEVVQLFQQEQHSANRYADINKRYLRSTIRSNIYDVALYALVDGVAALVTAAILYWGLGVNFGIVELSSVIVFIDMVERIFIPIRDLSGKFATIQQAIAALERIFTLLFCPDKITSGSHKVPRGEMKIEFDHVFFRYKEEGEWILKDISFEVNPGEVVALVGATGSGKSTIIKLLARAYDGYQGKIALNGYDLKQLDLHDVRSQIATVQQNIDLFPGTLRENITLGNPNITEYDLQQAIYITRVNRMLTSLPGGLDFIVKENGANLSTGQAQLIIFARAMAHNCPVVVMDEATASVDSLTEIWIQEALEEILQRRTVIVIAHRLSTIRKADTILVMQKGEIIQRGKHEELAAESGGYYSQLLSSIQEQEEQATN